MTPDETKKTPDRATIIRDGSTRIGAAAAKIVFDQRSRGDRRNVEIHIDEHTLATLFAKVYEAGLRDGLTVHESESKKDAPA